MRFLASLLVAAFLAGGLFWGPAATGQAAPSRERQLQAKAGDPFAHEPIYYYNGPMRVEAALALDELAVAAPKGQKASIAAVQSLAPDGVAIENGTVAQVRYATPASGRSELEQRAAMLASGSGNICAVVYPSGTTKREKHSTQLLTTRFSLKLHAPGELNSILQRYNLRIVRTITYSPNTYIVETSSPGLTAGLDAANAIYESGAAVFATPLLMRWRLPRLTPNDPLFGNQWHLENTGQAGGVVAGNDVNIKTAWDEVTGAGVNIAITDSGVEVVHPDLNDNCRTDIDYDFNSDDDDPTPASDPHGTSCAGIAAAETNNSTGVAGAGFGAKLVGLRLIENFTTDQEEADAMNHQVTPVNAADRVHINSNSWGPPDDAISLIAPGPLMQAAFENATTLGRGGLGTIFVWAAGNGRSAFDNVNYDGYANNRYTIAVGASGGNGVFSSYSEPGAAMLVNAPSSWSSFGTTTTTTGSGYTSGFGGTSSACPLVAGVIALMLEANPNLGWRDVQHILVTTAEKNDPTNPGWFNNGAGLHFNHNYGFGRVDAQAAVDAAQSWVNKPPNVTPLTNSATFTQSIPDNSAAGVTRTLNISGPSNFRIEHVEVIFNATHALRGDLKVELTSPSGSTSVLANVSLSPESNYTNWEFVSVAHWNEPANGTWSIKVADLDSGTLGTFTGWTLTIHGYLLPSTPVWADFSYSGAEYGTETQPFNTLDEALANVSSGGTVMVDAGTTNETLAIQQNVRIEAVGGLVRVGLLSKGGDFLGRDGRDRSGYRRVSGDNMDAEARRARWRAVIETLRERFLGDRLNRTDKRAGGESQDTAGALFEPALPYTQTLQPGAPVAVRLRSADEIDPSTIRVGTGGARIDPATVAWQPAHDGDLRDVWVIFHPDHASEFEDVVSVQVNAETVSGASAEGVAEFVRGEHEDVAEDVHATIAPVEGDPAGIAAPLAIAPAEVFESPQRVWLPLPEGVAAADVKVMYYIARGTNAGWHDGESIAGWLVPESYAAVEQDGVVYFGFLVNHAGILQLAPRE